MELLAQGLAQPALSLFDELLAIDPDSLFLTLIHESRARALVDLGNPSEAVDVLRQAMTAQRARPNIQAYSALVFAELAVDLKRTDLFPEAIACLDELHDRGPFPAIHYRESAVRALIADHRGDGPSARRHAQEALAAAAALKAPFARHPDVGLVKSVDPQVHARLESLAAA